VPTSPDAAVEPADLGSRLVALVVDGILVVVLALPVALVVATNEDPATGGVAIPLLWFVYRAFTDGTGGSLGKRLLRLRVIGARGPRPGLGAGATRNLWGLSGLLPAVMHPAVGNAIAVAVSVAIAISIARDPAERGWHDRIAGTAVRRPA
jgi:uncharacterized RDD family membrane protein YckC